MGHFSHNCKLTGLPITGGKAVLIVMKPQEHLWENSEEHLRKYGKTYMCSNDGPRLKYIPCWFPIKGEYDTYGRLENIVKDDNTAVLEEYYNMTIEELIDIVCSGRKDDGYDGSLAKIKKPIEYPEGWIEGDDHIKFYSRTQNDPQPFDGNYPSDYNSKYKVYRDGKMVKATKEEFDADNKIINEHWDRYNVWIENNPDPEDDYGKPQYEDKYKELLTLSGMWVHGDVYEQLTKEKVNDQWKDSLDLGTPELLRALGFEQKGKKKNGRYNIPFTKDDLTIYSDGTWLEVPGESIYCLIDLKKYCKKKNVDIDIKEIDKKDKYEQIFDYVIPTFGTPKPLKIPTKEEIDEFKSGIKDMKIKSGDLSKYFDFKSDDEISELLTAIDNASLDSSQLAMQVYRMFLNTDRYGSTHLRNDLTRVYLEKAKEGKLRSNIIEFWRFDSYMFACGRYYEIVGTGPQDGDHKQVLKVLTTAIEILSNEIKERYEDDYDNEGEDDTIDGGIVQSTEGGIFPSENDVYLNN